MNRFILIALCLATVSCNSSSSIISAEIVRQTQSQPNSVSFTQFQLSSWERVCFFGPYSQNNRFKKTTGFSWPLIAMTDIASSDTINVLVFIKGHSVVGYTEHPRHQADFWRLSGQCFNKEQSIFTKQAGNYIHANAAQQGTPADPPASASLRLAVG